MNRNNESLNFDHKSHYNDDRDSYIDKNGNYVYPQWVKVGKSYERRVVDIIPLTEENRDIIILLDGSDHDMDLQDRYAAENADYEWRTGSRGRLTEARQMEMMTRLSILIRWKVSPILGPML